MVIATMRRAKAATSGNRRPTRLVVQTEAIEVPTRAPKLPHEHDESAEEQEPSPDQRPVQGYIDLERGLIDTDRRQDAARAFDVARRKKPKAR
jgi:hypothetical protein